MSPYIVLLKWPSHIDRTPACHRIDGPGISVNVTTKASLPARHFVADAYRTQENGNIIRPSRVNGYWVTDQQLS
jgi:hypothetical protein